MSDQKYDSTGDTLHHIRRVMMLLGEVAMIFIRRQGLHDISKLEEPEKSAFDEYTPKLAALTYGSDEYRNMLKELAPALASHYSKNRHHPEFFKNGINDMNLFDVVEMLMDWKAASERHNDGNIWKSIDINVERFTIDPQLAGIIYNTARAMFGERPFEFQKIVVEGSMAKPVLVDFYLDTCQPCKILAPKLEQLAKDLVKDEKAKEEGQVAFDLIKLDASKERNLSMKYKVSSVPRLLIFNGGQLVADSIDAKGDRHKWAAEQMDLLINGASAVPQ